MTLLHPGESSARPNRRLWPRRRTADVDVPAPSAGRSAVIH